MARQMNSFEKEGLKAFNKQLENSFGLTAKAREFNNAKQPQYGTT